MLIKGPVHINRLKPFLCFLILLLLMLLLSLFVAYERLRV